MSLISKKLQEIAHINYGTRVVQKRDGGTIYPVYGGGGATFKMDIFNREDCFIVSRFAMSAKCTRFVKGKFFLNDSGLSVETKDKNILLQNFLDRYLFYLNDDIYALSRGAAQRNLDVDAFKNLTVTFPPLSAQQQIVEKLDTAFDLIDRAKANIEKNIQNAKELFQSKLNQVFSEKGEGWEEKKIEEVCENIVAGGDAPKNNFSAERNDKFSIPIYANAVKLNGLYGYTDSCKIKKPSLTIAARGSGTGFTCIRLEPFFPIVRLLVLTPNDSIDLKFLKLSIDNQVIKASGSAIPQFTVPMLKMLTIYLPKTIAEQEKIVSNLELLSEQTKLLQHKYQEKLAHLEELKKSILEKAFKGELA